MSYKVTITQHNKYTETIQGKSFDFEDEVIPLVNLIMSVFDNVDVDINISNMDEVEIEKEDE